MNSLGKTSKLRDFISSISMVNHRPAGIAGVVVSCHLIACTGGLHVHDSPPRTPVSSGTIVQARSDDGETMQFRIDSITAEEHDRDGDVWLYGVSVQDAGSDTWHPYCLPDASGRAAAIPVQGSWSQDGEPLPDAGLITFACTSGAIGKCIRFGYKPWKTIGGISLRPYHAACVRMVRADYCGDNRPHTVDGTIIDIWDELGIQKRDQQESHPEVFEAAWGPAGAAYLNVPRWSDDVSDVVAECPAHFAGRTSKDRPLAPSQLRERFPEALIFDARFVLHQDRQRDLGPQ